MSKKHKRPLTSKVPATKGYAPIDQRWYQRPRDLPPFTFLTVRSMLLDPTIRLGLAMRAAPLCSAEFAYKLPGSDEWTEGVQADDPILAAFVYRQLKRLWTDVGELLKSQVWGWAAGEVMLRHVRPGEGEASRHFIELDRILPRHANDTRVLVCDGEPRKIRFMRVNDVAGGEVDLPFPKAIFHAHAPEPGQHYGTSVLHGAYSPFADKWFPGGALDVRKLFMQKDSYRGARIWYPNEIFQVGDKQVPARDIADQIVQQIKAGGVITLPSSIDPQTGKQRWQYEESVVASNPQHILDYPKDLDTEMLRGMEVPDDIFTADTDTSGAWAGKKVPLDGFYTGLDIWLTRLIRDVKHQLLDHLVAMNFGQGRWYEVTAKPLADQAMERQAKQAPQQGQQPPQFGSVGRDGDSDGQFGESGNGFQPRKNQPQRMGLDIEEAVGMGAVKAMELVGAARKAMNRKPGAHRLFAANSRETGASLSTDRRRSSRDPEKPSRSHRQNGQKKVEP